MVLASGLVALLVSGAFVVLLLAIDNLRESADETRDAREELTAADGLEKLVIDLETGVRGFVITGEKKFLDPWNEARAAFPGQARRLERLVADDPGHLRRVRRIARGAGSYVRDYAAPVVADARRGESSARSVAVTEEGRRRVGCGRSSTGSPGRSAPASRRARTVRTRPHGVPSLSVSRALAARSSSSSSSPVT
jgi:CHASE3 domain sensor protein